MSRSYLRSLRAEDGKSVNKGLIPMCSVVKGLGAIQVPVTLPAGGEDGKGWCLLLEVNNILDIRRRGVQRWDEMGHRVRHRVRM